MRSSGLRLAAAVIAAMGIITSLSSAAAPAQAAQSSPNMMWPTTGRITQAFGCTGFRLEPRNGSCRHFHFGIDIANGRATPIRAAADGVVTFIGLDPYLPASYRKYRSWTVVLRHGNGVRTFYAHLLKRDVAGIRTGRHVDRGQIIGYMGNTGLSTGVHLHFGVIVDHRWVNPTRFISEAQPRR